jgi:hypothetical protein
MSTDLAGAQDSALARLKQSALQVVQDSYAFTHDLNLADEKAALEALAARWSATDVTMVVAGEPNRGKSTLINAVLGRPGLMPVDHRVATSARLLVRYGSHERALIYLAGHDAPLTVPLADVETWATVAGTRARGDQAETVVGIELHVDHPLLRQGLQLVDTPGVGGLNSAHGKITLATLRHADAVLFVLDAHAPVTRPELDFLREATSRVGSVIFALAKTDDRAEEDWRALLAEDQRLLATEAPRFAQAAIVPVSARSAEQAEQHAAEGDTGRAQLLRDLGGMDELTGKLTDIIGKGRLLRMANAVEYCGALLVRCRSTYAARAGAADEEVQQRREQCVAQLAPDAPWRRLLASDLASLQHSVSVQGRDMIRDAIRPLRESVDSDKRPALQKAEQRAHDELLAVAMTLGEEVEQRLLDAVSNLERALAVEGLAGVLSDIAPVRPDAQELQPAGGSGFGELGRALPGNIYRAVTSGFFAHTLTAAGAAAATTGTATAGTLAAMAGTSAIFGPIGIAVGSVMIGVALYQGYRTGQMRRARQVYERAEEVGLRIVREIAWAVGGGDDPIGKTVTGEPALVRLEKLTTERLRARLDDLKADTEQQVSARSRLAAIDALQDRRAALRGEVAEALAATAR